MPKLNGMDLVLRIRREPKLKDLPSVLVSDINDRYTVQLAALLDVKGFIVKPFAIEQFAQKIDAALA